MCSGLTHCRRSPIIVSARYGQNQGLIPSQSETGHHTLFWNRGETVLLALETPSRFEIGCDFDERCLAFLPGVSLDPAQLRIEYLVEPPILFSFLDNCHGSTDH